MAKQKSTGAAVPSYSEDSDWKARGDHDTMKRAAEIFVDKTRMKGVLREIKRADAVDRCLDKMLTKFKSHGALHRSMGKAADY